MGDRPRGTGETLPCDRGPAPEWQDPNGSAIPIEFPDILKAANRTEPEIAALEEELESLAASPVR